MKTTRKHVIEPGEVVQVALADTPDPEKGVLNAKFRLTSLPALSDDDIAAAKRRKKGKKAMTNVDEQDEEVSKGRAPKYKLDLDSADVVVTDDELTKEQKDDEGKVVKTHRVQSKAIEVKSYVGLVNLFSNDESKALEFVSEAITAYYQRTDRQRLFAMAKGPEKDIIRAIESLVDAGFSKEKATAFVRAQFASEFNINISDEDLAAAEKKLNEQREKVREANRKRKAEEANKA